ncbi:M23 family metallopeptidase, partial [Nanoarchaeota archaeon]
MKAKIILIIFLVSLLIACSPDSDVDLTRNTYGLPIMRENGFQAVSNPEYHMGLFSNAVDFIAPEGDLVLAALDGVVSFVKDDSFEGGPDGKYTDVKYNNWINIRHDNGEYSQYVHIQGNS